MRAFVPLGTESKNSVWVDVGDPYEKASFHVNSRDYKMGAGEARPNKAFLGGSL